MKTKTRWLRAVVAGLLYSHWLWSAVALAVIARDKLKGGAADAALFLIWIWSIAVVAAIYAVVLHQPKAPQGGKQ